VPLTHAVHHDCRRPTAAKWAAGLPAAAWRPRSAGTGVQGERVDAWACLPLEEATAPGWRRWLLVRRGAIDPGGLAFYVAHGPAGTTEEELVRVCGRRWEGEEGFAQAKGEVGLDQYEVRTWTAWYRSVTLALLAHAYLAATRRAAQRDEAAGKGGARIPACSRSRSWRCAASCSPWPSAARAVRTACSGRGGAAPTRPAPTAATLRGAPASEPSGPPAPPPAGPPRRSRS
jgi:hypothetical protein